MDHQFTPVTRVLRCAALAVVLLATSCATVTVVGENGIGLSPAESAALAPPVDASDQTPSPSAVQPALDVTNTGSTPAPAPDVLAEETAMPDAPAEEPTAPETAEPAETALEPVDASADGSSATFESAGGRAPVFATGTGGGCPAPDGIWANGFEVVVFSRRASGAFIADTLAISTEAVQNPIISIIETLPREAAWERLSTQLAGTDALASFPSDDPLSGFSFTIFGGPEEDQLSALIETLRVLPSTVAVTENRCTDNAVAQLVEG